MTVVVLLEGASDVNALRVLLTARGLDAEARPQRGVELVNLHGITNIRTALTGIRQRTPSAPSPEILGLCDEGELRVVQRALAGGAGELPSADELAERGFFVCRADLEDELIRALGTGGVLEVFDRLGLRAKFEAFGQQLVWRGRPLPDQLHRFAGIASGRKIWLAGELAAALSPDQIPDPLARLLDRIAAAIITPTPQEAT